MCSEEEEAVNENGSESEANKNKDEVDLGADQARREHLYIYILHHTIRVETLVYK